MAAIIKPIEAKSVHQIQSGQVIVDLCSVVKELVENALDANATSLEVRFKNHGLESIEVQDNGTGISEANYESLALKHYTSKLSTYDDLSQLQTFGFRGEALSSLCALSTFSVVTAQAHESPRGKKLEFETSGKLKSTSFIAAPKGSTVTVENLFSNLPVRQKELSKNIKREYGKVLGLLHAYACISTNVKFTVKNTLPKSRSAVVFSTKGNTTTRDNIANVYGAKMLAQLIELDLKLDFESSSIPKSENNTEADKVDVVGYISRPTFGEGRQTPDRQMFFVNGRPCGLPQIAKAINEVYKSYNVSQSPFIFADFRLDTNNYDVNVSPDKRTIFLHNAAVLTDRLKEELTKEFDQTEQTVPQSHVRRTQLPAFRQLTMSRESSNASLLSKGSESPTVESGHSYDIDSAGLDVDDAENTVATDLLHQHFADFTSTREQQPQTIKRSNSANTRESKEKRAQKIAKVIEKQYHQTDNVDRNNEPDDLGGNYSQSRSIGHKDYANVQVLDFNARMQETQNKIAKEEETPHTGSRSKSTQSRIPDIGVVQDTFDRARPRRLSPEMATITIGDKVITRMIGTPKTRTETKHDALPTKTIAVSQFSQNLRKFNVGIGDDDDVVNENNKYSDKDVEDPALEADNDTFNHHKDTYAEDTERNWSPPNLDDIKLKSKPKPVEDYAINEENKLDIEAQADRTQEEYRVAELIRFAESTKHADNKDHQKRAAQALKGSASRESTTNLVAVANVNLKTLVKEYQILALEHQGCKNSILPKVKEEQSLSANEEERLSLTISKSDFSTMHVAGQFNLGFVVALRHKDISDCARQKDELFIIDQHASDEKYNFERLQAETVVGNQRLVHPVILDLTAVEEEIVLDNSEALRQNGFIIEGDTSGNTPVGQRCRLLSLPLSKEVTFNIKDLEELIHLLSESHISSESAFIPRPGKVRKMFAMRACRSSIMIGKTLSMRQMKNILDHMGRIDKPWNCPHGRPTMRHLLSLDDMEEQLWNEGDGVLLEEGRATFERPEIDIWKAFMHQ